jgi:hypothetical protein
MGLEDHKNDDFAKTHSRSFSRADLIRTAEESGLRTKGGDFVDPECIDLSPEDYDIAEDGACHAADDVSGIVDGGKKVKENDDDDDDTKETSLYLGGNRTAAIAGGALTEEQLLDMFFSGRKKSPAVATDRAKTDPSNPLFAMPDNSRPFASFLPSDTTTNEEPSAPTALATKTKNPTILKKLALIAQNCYAQLISAINWVKQRLQPGKKT